MDLPATQTIDDDELVPTQQFLVDEKNETAVVGTLQIVNGQQYPIVTGITTIGRSPICKIVISDESVSKNHAEIEAESVDGSIFIKDLKSLNKTKINDTKLRPNALYQIKDGDRLQFGMIKATFKLYTAIDDSFTLQINKNIASIIPSTPDSSMNVSSGSENDVSTIPGSQTDEIKTCFKRPQVPVKTSITDNQRSPKISEFILDDLPTLDESIYDMETQRPFNFLDKDKNMIENLQNQKLNQTSNKNKSSNETTCTIEIQKKTYDVAESIKNFETEKINDKKLNLNKEKLFNESIYSAETQKNISHDEFIENLETQKFDSEKRKSNDVSIYSAETQKVMSEDGSIENLETQKFDYNIDSDKRKSKDVSIYSAETQKLMPEDFSSIENLETQKFDYQIDSEKRKSNDTSIYSAETQKVMSEDGSIENLETQKFDYNIDSDKRKSKDISIYSAETQKVMPEDFSSMENLETQKFDYKIDSEKRKSNDTSIYSAETQKVMSEDFSSIENFETQKFDYKIDSEKRKSNDVSIYSAETQKVMSEDGSIENLATQKFDYNIDSDKRKSKDVSIYSAETQKLMPEDFSSMENLETQKFDYKIDSEKRKSNDTSIYSAETQKVMSEDFSSIENLETQKFDYKIDSEKRKSNDTSIYSAATQKITSQDVGSIENLATQKFDYNIDSEKRKSNDISIYSAATQKVTSEDIGSIENLETQKFDYNIDSEKRKVSSSSNKIHNSTITNNDSYTNISKINASVDSSSFETSTVPVNLNNTEQTRKVIEEDDEVDMFCSQNLIEDCPIAFLAEESQNKMQQSNKETGNDSETDEEVMFSDHSLKENESAQLNNENDKIIDDEDDENDSETDKESIFSGFSNKNEGGKLSSENKKDTSDSETDEEGKFSEHFSKENETPQLNNENEKTVEDEKNDNGSETDEEGKFSEHFSKENVIPQLNNENEKTVEDEKNNDSETDEEGKLSEHFSKENESPKLNNKNTKIVANEKNDNDSETDEEGKFSEHFSKENETPQLNNENEKTVEDEKNDNGSETDEEGKFSEHFSKENESVKLNNEKNNTVNDKMSESSSESDEEAIFSSHLLRESEHNEVNANNIERSKNKKIDKLISEDGSLAITQKIDAQLLTESLPPTQKIDSQQCTESLEPTQKIDTQLSAESLALTLRIDSEQCTESLAPTQKIDTQLSAKSLALKLRIDSEQCTESLAPTQKIDTQLSAESLALTLRIDSEQCTESLPPTQKIDSQQCTESLAPTQKIDSQQCTESLEPTQKIDTQLSAKSLALTLRIDSEQDTKSLPPTQKIDTQQHTESFSVTNCHQISVCKMVSSETVNLSKRQLEETEITSTKKIKTNDSKSIKIDFKSGVEKNLDEMFDGPEEKSIDEDSSLLTQELTNILESNHTENISNKKDLNVTTSSPTLGSKRCNARTRHRRKGVLLQKKNSSSLVLKQSISFNDTVERNLNEMFNDSINDTTECESSILMTQQLKDILESQENSQTEMDEKMESRCTSLSGKEKQSSSLINLNISLILKNQNEKEKLSIIGSISNLDKTQSTLQEVENSNKELHNGQGTKKDKKGNAFNDSLIEEDSTGHQVSSGYEKEIIYKKGTIGFDRDNKPVSTKECVAFLEPKGRSFTSDSQSSQSDAEDSFNSSSKATFKASNKKRFSLNLNGNVNLNSFQLLEKNESIEKRLSSVQKKHEIPSAKNSGNNVIKLTSAHVRNSATVPRRQVRARSTIGFSSGGIDGHAVEGEELVSAASTESEDDKVPGVSTKVCNSINYLCKDIDSNNVAMKVTNAQASNPKSVSDDDKTDSDEEFLRSLPAIKVAGTLDCPATNSQLAAQSDHEDSDSISLEDFAMQTKWKLYADRRFDHIYKKIDKVKDLKKENSENQKIDKMLENSLTEKKTNIFDVDEFLKSIESKKQRKIRDSKNNVVTSSDSDSEANNKRILTRSRQKRSIKKSNRSSSRENSPNIEIVKSDDEQSANKNEDDSNSDSSSIRLIPKYKPLKSIKLDLNALLRSEMDDDSDEEFEALREKCEKMLASTSTSKSLGTQNLKKIDEKTSPVLTRRKRKSALSNSNSLNITRSKSPEKFPPKTRAVVKDTLVFQVSSESSKKPTASRMSGLTIIRNKRTMDTNVDDSQNKPPKRIKTNDGQIHLQEVSVLVTPLRCRLINNRFIDRSRNIDVNISSTFKQPVIANIHSEKKRSTKVPKSLENNVLQQKSKSISDSSDLSAVENSIVEDKKENELSSKVRKFTIKAVNVNNAKDSSSSKLNDKNLSKNSVIVEDSDVESGSEIQNARISRIKRKAMDSSVSSKGSIECAPLSSGTDSENTKKLRGRSRRNQKSETVHETKLEKKTTQYSHLDQSEEIKLDSHKKIKNLRSKILKESDSETSDKSESILYSINKETRSKKTKSLKNLESKNLATRSRRRKVNDQFSDSMPSESNSDTETKKNIFAANKSTRSNPVRQTRKTAAANTNIVGTTSSEESQELDNKIKNVSASNQLKSISVKLTRSHVAASKSKIKPNLSEESQESDVTNSPRKKLSNLNKSTSSQRRITRKRTTRNISAVEPSSSEESQEVEEIMKNSEEKTQNSYRTRRGRISKKDDVGNNSSSLENSQNSDDKKSSFDDVFEKPKSRPKRAKLNNSANNKSANILDVKSQRDLKERDSLYNTLSLHEKKSSAQILSSPKTCSSTTIRRSMSPMKKLSHKILFTGEKSEVHRQIVAKLGGSEVEDLAKCSILVTDKVRRTFKFLCSLARGIPIVSVKWLDDSKKAQHFLEWEDYILKDPEAETKFKFNLKESLEKARQHKMLEGYTILLTSKIAPPPISELKEMVISSGGKALVKAPTRWTEKTVIITKENDLNSAKKLIAKAPKSVTVHSTELILTGILRQDLNLIEFKISL